jgi:glutaredoxin
MFDYLEYTEVEGDLRNHDIEVYALSTCGFCKRGLAFLRENRIAFRYIYVDLIPLEVKTRVKEALRAKFNEHISFPYVVIDGKSTLIGFLEPDWCKTFLEN